MQISSLRLNSFRNYEQLKLNFADNVNIFYGDNAQGKTNILEAIFLCAAGRSHRTSRDNDLIKFNNNGYFISLDIKRNNSESNVEIVYSNNEKKKIKINDKPITKIGDLMGNLNAVLFSPEDLMIIKEGPSERRRFIDITLCQLKPSYFYDLQMYNKVLHQRNTLLKNIQQKPSLNETLDVWDNNLIIIGSKIVKARKEFVDNLNLFIEATHYGLTDDSEKLSIEYQPSFDIFQDKNKKDNKNERERDIISIKDIEKEFRNRLESLRRKEILRAVTLVGPQRDDYEIKLNDTSIKMYGSQGQQRTAILSIKLSEIEIMRQSTGECPVLLLDDVLSELDKKRQEYLLSRLGNIQTFITSTDKYLVTGKERVEQYKYYYVYSGKVRED